MTDHISSSLRAFAVCAWLLCLPQLAHAEGLPYEYITTTSDSTLQTALDSNNWQSGVGDANFGFAGQPRWLRYSVPAQDQRRIFSINNPWLAHIDVYLLSGDEVLETYQTGTTRPQSARPITSSIFAYGIAPEVTDIYVYHKGISVAYFPVQLQSAAEYSNTAAILNAFHGIYYGIILIMILYNIAMSMGLKDSVYLNYGLYASCLMVFLSNVDGSGPQFLWPEAPWVQPVVFPMSWGLTFFFLLEFAVRFLSLTDQPRIVLAKRVTQICVILVASAIVLSPSATAYSIQNIVSSMCLILLLYAGVYALRNKAPNAKLFLISNGLVAVGGFGHICMLFGWVAPTLVLQHSVHLGSIAELALLSIGLVRRLRESDRARYAAFEKSQELSRRNKELSTAKALAEEHRQLQKSLQQAQKLKTIGQLAGGFAHDFNNILASILGFAELARDKSSITDRSTLLRYLDEINKSGERGANLVKQLLVYSRSTAVSPQDLNLKETIEQGHALLRGSLPATVSIDAHLPEQNVPLFIDPEQLQQVLVNLCINAAESMQNRGKIDIRLETARPTSISCTSCSARFSGDYIAIKVEDTGAGIRGNAEQLFTPFHTSKEVGQGTGLGLSVVHGIVHEHGGHIHAANRADGGARFVVYLPPKVAPTPTAEKGKRILLIEDDPSVARYLETLLGDDTFQTTFATMPTQALETFVKNPEAFDLVITDYLMPQGTGLELAEDIHALRPDLPVILTTGNANNLDDAAVASASLAGIFEKPLNSEQLLAKVRGLLAS